MFDPQPVVRLVESLVEQSMTRRGQAGAENLAHELVAEAEAETVDPEDPALAQSLELLDELGLVDAQQSRERLRLERLLEHGGGEQDAVAPGAFGAALREQRPRDRGRPPAPVAVGDR